MTIEKVEKNGWVERDPVALTLNPRPTSLYHLRSFPAVFFPVDLILEFWKMGCFWKAFSVCSAAIVEAILKNVVRAALVGFGNAGGWVGVER